MRLLAATSGRTAQGRLTEAGERVGEITTGGTIGFLLFVGVGGGVVTAIGYLLVRRWLPPTAGRAGMIAGLLLIGTLGVSDPFSPDNVDFAILRPRWLAILSRRPLTGLLFATTYTAVAARLDRLAASRRPSPLAAVRIVHRAPRASASRCSPSATWAVVSCPGSGPDARDGAAERPWPAGS